MGDDEFVGIEDLDIEFDPMEGPIDLTPVLTRRFVWDIMPCDQVADVLKLLGLPPSGSDEGTNVDHMESHARLARVGPLEEHLQAFAPVLGVITAKSMAAASGATLTDEQEQAFAEQHAEVVLHSSRAIIANLMSAGIIDYAVGAVEFVVLEEDE